jgi:hypothetical protein
VRIRSSLYAIVRVPWINHLPQPGTAFGRANNPDLGKVAIIVANADGGNERVLLSAPITAAYTSPPSWSPDGRSIAYTETFLKDTLGRLSVADVETGHTRVVFSTDKMTLESPMWTPDGRNVLVLWASRKSGGTQRQIGSIAYPSGVFMTITNDTSAYSGLRLSGDGRSIVTVQARIKKGDRPRLRRGWTREHGDGTRLGARTPARNQLDAGRRGPIRAREPHRGEAAGRGRADGVHGYRRHGARSARAVRRRAGARVPVVVPHERQHATALARERGWNRPGAARRIRPHLQPDLFA